MYAQSVCTTSLMIGLAGSAFGCAQILNLDDYSGGTATSVGGGGSGGMGGTDLPAPTWRDPAMVGQPVVTLAPTRLFQRGALPMDAAALATSYAFCTIESGLNDQTARDSLRDNDGCPNDPIIESTPYSVIHPLKPDLSYYAKLRACADLNATVCGPWSDVLQVNTDNSVDGWWRLNDGSDVTAVDSSPAGNDGSLINFDLGTAWVPGHVGGALLFDGIDDYIAFGDIHNLNSDSEFSLEAWANRSTLGSFATILGRQDLTDPAIARGYWFSFSDDNRVWLQMVNETGIGNELDVLTTAQFDSPFTPLNILVTYDGSSAASGVKIYVDGIDQTTVTMLDGLTGTTLNSGPFRIGAMMAEGGPMTSTDLNFPGVLDDVIKYNRVLTQIEARNNCYAREALHRKEAGDMNPLSNDCE